MIIAKGIIYIKALSLFKKMFSIAGSNNQAVAEVLPATKIEKKAANNIFKIYNSTKKILFISFLKGLASGLGWIIGATILVSLLTYILSQIEFIPILGDIVSQLIQEIEAFDR